VSVASIVVRCEEWVGVTVIELEEVQTIGSVIAVFGDRADGRLPRNDSNGSAPLHRSGVTGVPHLTYSSGESCHRSLPRSWRHPVLMHPITRCAPGVRGRTTEAAYLSDRRTSSGTAGGSG